MRKLLLFALWAFCLNAIAQDVLPDTPSAEILSKKEMAEMIHTADQLVVYGYNTEQALPLIQALEIYNRFGVSDVPGSRVRESSTVDTTMYEPAKKESQVSFKIEDIIAAAMRFANGEESIQAMIKSVGTTRGRVGGPVRHHDNIPAHSTHIYRILFKGGEPVMVSLSGDGDTDLEMYIYDEDDNMVYDDAVFCSANEPIFTPKWTSRYKIKIVNKGNVYNRYVLSIN